ncbi:hypothetical protein Dimus_022929, partial [Dionaea muscipula]
EMLQLLLALILQLPLRLLQLTFPRDVIEVSPGGVVDANSLEPIGVDDSALTGHGDVGVSTRLTRADVEAPVHTQPRSEHSMTTWARSGISKKKSFNDYY